MDVPPAGRANGRTVTLFHGKHFFGAYWEGTARALAAAGYRVVIPDQIGFGKSSKPDIAYSFNLLAANTARVLDELGVRETAVVGHSMGGMLAVRFTRTYPERVTHLVLENPIGLEDYRLKVPPRPTDALVANEMNQTEAQIRAFIKTYPVRWVPEVFERYVEVRSRLRLSGEYPRWARAAALTYQMAYEQPVRYEFPLIQKPTLLVIGQSDRAALGKNAASEEMKATLGLYPELGRAAARDIPGAQLVELENVGHIPHLEVPERFQQALLDFLGR
jgi:pimeloyl-ACP methyl ester carboxylesterase